MTTCRRIAIVFDESVASLRALVDRCPVWLVDSEANTNAAEALWAEDDSTSNITTFTQPTGLLESALDQVMELVEDHHGEFAQDPPMAEVLVVGLELTTAVRGVLRDWGFTEIRSTSDGLLAIRASDRPVQPS